MKSIPRIVITPGEPAGIGPEITMQVTQHAWDAELITVCDPELLKFRAKKINLPLTIQNFDPSKPATTHKPGTLLCIPIELSANCIPGQLNHDNARYVIECLKVAAKYCLESKNTAMVTGPVQKSIINEAGIAFTGHTEFLAEICRASKSIMLFVVDKIRVALATTHLPLLKVPTSITQSLLIETILLLNSELEKKFNIQNPRILVCGLNPHAGENGHLGKEEIEIIQPALNHLRERNINIIGPLPADTVFTEKHLTQCDIVLAMYHDQALPVVKYMSFGHAVNVTLGLPIIRTSVDHGTALDIAGTPNADAGSLSAAIKLAIALVNTSRATP